MAVIYSSDTFLPALTGNEDFLKIRDQNGAIRYKIYNNTIASTYVLQDKLVLKTEADSKVINLKFSTSADARNAIIKLQKYLTTIRSNFNKIYLTGNIDGGESNSNYNQIPIIDGGNAMSNYNQIPIIDGGSSY